MTRKSKQLLKITTTNDILDNIACGVGIFELHSTIRPLFTNKNFSLFTSDYDATDFELFSHDALWNIHPDDKLTFCDKIQESAKKLVAFEITYRAARKSGGYSYINAKICPIEYIACDNPVFLATLTDVTEAKEYEAKLKHQSDFLSDVFHIIPCGILLFSPIEPFTLIDANSEAIRLFQYNSLEEMQKVYALDLIYHEDEAELIALIDNAQDSLVPINYQHRAVRKDKSTFWVGGALMNSSISDGSPVILLAFTDITKDKLAYFALENEQERYRIVMNLSNVIVFDYNYENDIFIFYDNSPKTDSSISLHKTVIDHYLERIKIENIIHPDDIDNYIDSIQNEYTFPNEVRIHNFGDTVDVYSWYSIQCNPIKDGNQVLRLVGTMINIDMYKQNELDTRKTLAKARDQAEQANTAKTDFISRMSHDIRTPMNAIVGMTTIAQMSIENKTRVLDCLAKINISSKYLMELLNDILDISKIERGELILSPVTFSFEGWIRNITTIISPQASDRDISFEIGIKCPINLSIHGDDVRLTRIIMNLLSNALHYTKPGGKVLLSVRECSKKNNMIDLEFVIRDDGIGMSPEFMEKMYEPFEQAHIDDVRNYAGSGLGLSIVKNFVQLMNGTIHVESQLEIGTTFTIVIPLQIVPTNHLDKKPATPYDNNNLASLDTPRAHLLLAEDNEINMEIAKVLLEFKHYQVDVVEDGQKAVERFLASENFYYSAILMDIRMPVMDGLKATQSIRAIKSQYALNIPIIAMTANAFYADMEEAYSCGMTDYITKPVDPSHLYKVLEKHC